MHLFFFVEPEEASYHTNNYKYQNKEWHNNSRKATAADPEFNLKGTEHLWSKTEDLQQLEKEVLLILFCISGNLSAEKLPWGSATWLRTWIAQNSLVFAGYKSSVRDGCHNDGWGGSDVASWGRSKGVLQGAVWLRHLKMNSSALTVLSTTNLYLDWHPHCLKLGRNTQGKVFPSEANFCSSSHHLALCYFSWPSTDPGLAANAPCRSNELCWLSQWPQNEMKGEHLPHGWQKRHISSHPLQTCLCCIFGIENESKPKNTEALQSHSPLDLPMTGWSTQWWPRHEVSCHFWKISWCGSHLSFAPRRSLLKQHLCRAQHPPKPTGIWRGDPHPWI